MKKLFYILAMAVAVASCGGTSGLTRGSLYPKMYEEKPVTLLVMPPINKTTHVEAKELLYTSISRPLAEAGYYVISPLLAMDIFKAESAYDAEMFVDGPLDSFGNFFGADAVVFSVIDDWNKRGFGIDVDIRYIIRSVKTGETLFDRKCELRLDLNSSSSNSNSSWLGVLVDAASSAIATTATEHIVAARKANYYIFRDIPQGKYSPVYMQDQTVKADESNISMTVK